MLRVLTWASEAPSRGPTPRLRIYLAGSSPTAAQVHQSKPMSGMTMEHLAPTVGPRAKPTTSTHPPFATGERISSVGRSPPSLRLDPISQGWKQLPRVLCSVRALRQRDIFIHWTEKEIGSSSSIKVKCRILNPLAASFHQRWIRTSMFLDATRAFQNKKGKVSCTA